MSGSLKGSGGALAAGIAQKLRERLIAGELPAGTRLSEAALAGELGVSRNSLREAFRLLGRDGLVRHQPNRGVFVPVPDLATVRDIYRVRRVIQRGAIEAAHSDHPALAQMTREVGAAEASRAQRDWRQVAGHNIGFHRAMVTLAESPRLSAVFDNVMAELRLVFGLVADPDLLHRPYVSLNAALSQRIIAGDTAGAVQALEAYLARSEQSLVAVLGG